MIYFLIGVTGAYLAMVMAEKVLLEFSNARSIIFFTGLIFILGYVLGLVLG